MKWFSRYKISLTRGGFKLADAGEMTAGALSFCLEFVDFTYALMPFHAEHYVCHLLQWDMSVLATL